MPVINTIKNAKKREARKHLVLFDAHAIIHRAYHALPDFSTSSGEPTGGLYGVASMLIKIINELEPDYMAACFDLPEPTFRHEAYEEYKAGRAELEDELVAQIDRSRDIFEAFHIPIYEAAGFEADDVLGTIVEKLKGGDTDIIIASGDMDTLQLVDKKRVQVYTLRKGLSDTVMYDEKGVRERFGFDPSYLADFKGLRGDPSDNIVGVKGIGEKTATALIQAFGSIENIYKKLKKNESVFEEKGFKPRIINLLKENEEEAQFSKTLATIRTDAPISFKIPKKTWRDAFDLERIEKLFTELEFRTLLARAKEAFGGGTEEGEAKPAPAEGSGGAKEEEPSEQEVKEVGIALWLLRSDITTPTKEDILQYARTHSFKKAKEMIFYTLREEGLEKVYTEIELPIVPIIERAQERGIGVDLSYLDDLSKDYHKKLSGIEKRIFDLAGEEFNVNSPKQLGEVLFDKMKLSAKGLKKTAGGARSTRESELQKLAGEHEIIDEILKHRELQKLLSTYIDTIPELADKSGRVHTTLHQDGTTTGRFSSTNPNLQNIPTREGFGEAVRNAFVAERGHTLLAFDYSQIEMWALAVLSSDDTLMDVFKKGEDVHASVAAHVFDVEESEVTKEQRRKAKVINFGIVYGMGVNALRQNLGGSRQEAQEFYNNYFKKFPQIAKYFEQVKNQAAKRGYTETLFGRRRYFEGINSSIPYIRAAAERQAMNAPIQGTAADIIKIAIREVDKKLQEQKLIDKAHLLLQVHDELIYEVKDSEVAKAKDLIRETMEDVADIPVPLIIDALEGKRWGKLH